MMERSGAQAIGLLILIAAVPANAATRRIAVVVGNNAGTGEYPPLRYAETDAGKMARVLTDVGEVAPDDLFLLQGRGLADLEQALQLVQTRVDYFHRAPDTRVLLIFYFSGHSDGEALELGKDRFPFSRLHGLLAGTSADVRVAIIDSCRSGAAVLPKGARPAPGFTIRLQDQLTATGDVFVTSSAADELALESKEVMGSYFTHHLVSGMRGAADTSGDKHVTLSEAYRYAYDHTVSATSATTVGTQHPTYDIRLSGQGELVLANLEKPSALLRLPGGFERIFVADVARDQIVAELPEGAAREIALAPGTYGIRAFLQGKALVTRVRLGAGSICDVAPGDLQPADVPLVAAKGAEGSANVEQSLVASGEGARIAVAVGATSTIAKGTAFAWGMRIGFEGESLHGFELAATGSTASGPDASYQENNASLRVGYPFRLHLNPVTLSASVEGGVGYVWQTVPNGPVGASLAGLLGPRLMGRMRLSQHVSLSLEAEAMVTALSIDGGFAVRVMPQGYLGAEFDL
jgi:hypothetical protein